MWAVRSRAKREASGLGRKGSWAVWCEWKRAQAGKQTGPGFALGRDLGLAGFPGPGLGLSFVLGFLSISPFLFLNQTKFEFKVEFEFKPHSNKNYAPACMQQKKN